MVSSIFGDTVFLGLRVGTIEASGPIGGCVGDITMRICLKNLLIVPI